MNNFNLFFKSNVDSMVRIDFSDNLYYLSSNGRVCVYQLDLDLLPTPSTGYTLASEQEFNDFTENQLVKLIFAFNIPFEKFTPYCSGLSRSINLTSCK